MTPQSGGFTFIGVVAVLAAVLTTPHISLDVFPALVGCGLVWYGGRVSR